MHTHKTEDEQEYTTQCQNYWQILSCECKKKEQSLKRGVITECLFRPQTKQNLDMWNRSQKKSTTGDSIELTHGDESPNSIYLRKQ